MRLLGLGGPNMEEFEEAAWRLCQLNKMLRYSVLKYLPWRTGQYGCDLGTGEEEQVHPMLE
jgi:hypothetical protein